MAWLVREGEVLAAVEVAASRRERRRGLLGRDSVEGGLLLRPARAVHTLGMRFPIDVAYLTELLPDGSEFSVLSTKTMPRYRVGRPRVRARSVLEAEAGAFARWRLQPGDRVEIKG